MALGQDDVIAAPTLPSRHGKEAKISHFEVIYQYLSNIQRYK